ncbi:MAG: HAMP domain-containing protein [Burkholderiaceae bacterium]|nr:HAMP domain-containing protein [Burkholderiaceae bacterium]
MHPRWEALRGSLQRRYATIFVLVVSVPLLVSAVVSASLAHQQQREAIAALQDAQADASAVRILQFLREVELQLAWLTALPWGEDATQQRRLDMLRAMRQAPAITDLVLLDEAGRERVAESRLELSRIDTLADRSASPAFAGARANRVYHGDVYFRKGSEPFVTLAVAGSDPAAGVAVAEVSLKHIWDVVSRIHFGREGIVYVVDRAARLIAHPDIQLVLRNTDLSTVRQAFEFRQDGAASPRAVRMQGTLGKPVLATSRRIELTGWHVVVEQPLEEADEPVRAAVRAAVWVAAGSLALALAAALWSAWRMVRPLRALAQGAERIGAGQLSHRIQLKSGDELERLGERFNDMAGELQASYGSLERKVEERTRALSEANRAKSRLLAAASHDLRQPLHALNLLVAQQRIEPDPRERDRLAARVEAAVASINTLFDGLLDVSKLDAGVVRPEPSAVPVQRILDQMDITYSGAARAKGLELRIRPHDAWVCSDPVLLERVLGNLVANAVRYTRHGGVLVGCRRTGAGLRIMVCDTGIGIPADKLPDIFQEFYQVAPEGSGRGEGLGLGLSIVTRLCALMAHPIEVRSVPGRGSCFSVTVPLAQPGQTPASAAPEPAFDALRGRRVLVIDNDDQVLDSTARLLAGWGCRVRALKAAPHTADVDSAPPELLLVDFQLDDGDDGLAVVKRLRVALHQPVPALIMTGDVSALTRQRIADSGLPMLEKPVSGLRLRTVMTRLLQRA